MSQDPFHRLQDAFHRASALSGEERQAFLEEECAGDEQLRCQLEDLLARDENGHSRVRVDLAESAREALSAGPGRTPRRIGPYEILGLLGRGGMGVVYRARQENPDRVVALKLLRPAVFSEKLTQRFEQEKQVLARLQHRGIAQIHEAGTTDLGLGTQPWFAMELIEGAKLSDWAAGRSTREKLELVVELCDAVHHAHLRGVIHRDLKPDNILVGHDGRPKVLDFGVARVTDSDVQMTTVQTDVKSLIGTLPYMSPEQAQGDTENLDARSDVYALGVLTYEMLSGELPYDLRNKPVAVAARVIADDDPTPLSSVDRVFRGDLETIVGKALEKEPERRYATAEELAADLGRYLRDEPIRAVPPSTLYQLRKFAKRNKKLALMTVGAFVALLGGTVVSTVLALRESRARDAAVEQADRAEKIARFALRALAPNDPERSMSIEDIFGHAAEEIPTHLADHPDMAAELYYALANLYLAIGRTSDGEEMARLAVEGHRLIQEEFPEKYENSLLLLNGCFERQRNPRGSAATWAEVARLRERRLGPEALETLDAKVFHVTSLGMAGELQQASRILTEVAPAVMDLRRGRLIRNVGATYYRNGEFRAAVAALSPLVAEDPEPGLEIEPDDYFWVLFQLSALHADIGRLEDADLLSRKMINSSHLAQTKDDTSTAAYGNYMRGHVLHVLGEHIESEALARRAIAVFDKKGFHAAFAWRELGMALLGQGRLEEAEAALQEYLDRQRNNPGDGEWYVGQAESLLAIAWREQGRLDEAAALGRAAVERQRRVLRPLHPRIADALEPLAATLIAKGELDEAALAIEDGLTIRRDAMDEGAPPIANLLALRAEIELARGDSGAATASAERAVLDLQAGLPHEHPDLLRAFDVLERCLEE